MGDEPLGELTARALRGSWRGVPPPSSLTPEDLERVTPHLLATSAAGLGAWAIQGSSVLQASPSGVALRQAHLLHRLHAGLHDRRLAVLLRLCADVGVDPLLVKGWTVARRYPERGLRPYGDVDLVVREEDRDRLQAALDRRAVDADTVEVDLFHAFVIADGEGCEALTRKSLSVAFEGAPVRMLGPEDELRLTCLHYLRGGGWRALSLCDVALLLEDRPDDLDWSIVLPADQRRGWVRVAAGLAEDLLGADLRGTPLDGASRAVPPWIRNHVLAGFATTPAHRRPPSELKFTLPLNHLRAELRRRWPDPVELALHHRTRLRSRPPRHLLAVDLAQWLGARVAPNHLVRSPISISASVRAELFEQP